MRSRLRCFSQLTASLKARNKRHRKETTVPVRPQVEDVQNMLEKYRCPKTAYSQLAGIRMRGER